MVLGAPFRVVFSAFKVTILTPDVSPETRLSEGPFRIPGAVTPLILRQAQDRLLSLPQGARGWGEGTSPLHFFSVAEVYYWSFRTIILLKHRVRRISIKERKIECAG